MPSANAIMPTEASTLMMTEMLHRHANELATTLATLRVMKARGKIADDLLEQALIRVEAQAELHRLLLDRPADGTLCEALSSLAYLLLRSRVGVDKLKIAFSAVDVSVPMPLRIPILRCAYELIGNAIKHAQVCEVPISVAFVRNGRLFSFIVSNKTFTETGPRANSTGLEIVKSISSFWGGEMKISTSGGENCVSVSFRVAARAC